jgi:Holliday junction DNA helicase RuvA
VIVGLVGRVVKKEPTSLQLNVGGVIYEVFVSLNCSSKIISDEITLEITEIIREDAHNLYGFLDSNEKKINKVIKILDRYEKREGRFSI